MVVVQLEIPLPTVLHTVTLCHRHRVPVILDPAPAPQAPLPPELYQVTVFTPKPCTQTVLPCRIKATETPGTLFFFISTGTSFSSC